MLLFHGTVEEHIENIFKQGLVASSYHEKVYLSTTPIAGKGGDPISIAMGWPLKRERNGHHDPGYLVIIDLPAQGLDLLQDVIPNVSYDLYLQVANIAQNLHQIIIDDDTDGVARSGVNDLPSLTMWCFFYWMVHYFQSQAIPLETQAISEMLECHIRWRDPLLREDLTVQQWLSFLDEYCFFMDVQIGDSATSEQGERKRKNILEKHGIRLPEWIEEDQTSRSCRHCLESAFQYAYSIKGLQTYAPFQDFLLKCAERLNKKITLEQLLERQYQYTPYIFSMKSLFHPLVSVLRIVQSHISLYAEEDVQRFLVRSEGEPVLVPYKGYLSSWRWEEWYQTFPEQHPQLPSIWSSQMGLSKKKDVTIQDLRQDNCQVLASHIPPEYILGAIKISDGQRMLPHLRPNRRKGEALSSLLWPLIHRLRLQYAGKALIL